MSIRGVCRIIVVAIMLIGPGLGPMFQVNQVVAASVVPPAVSAATLAPPTASLNDIAAAPLAASGICTSTAPTGGFGEVPKGIAGRLVTPGGAPIKRAKVSLVQIIGGVETTVAVTNTATGDGTDNLNWLIGYFAFPPLDLSTLGGDGSFSLKFEAANKLTEYYLGRYSLQTAITLTATTLPDSTCDVRDKSNTPSLGTNPFAPGIKIYSLAGIAGRVTLAIPPDSLYASPPMSAPLTSDLYPVAGAQVDLLRISAANPNIITGTDTVSTDADGYYRIGDVLDSSSSNPDEVFVVRYSSPGLLPRPAEGGSYWRDGNLNFRPFINGLGLAQFPSYYITKTIRIDTSLIPVGSFRNYIISTPDSYPGIYGINGHLFAGSIVTGTVYSETNATIAPAGTKVQLYNKTGKILIDEKTTQVSDSGVFTFTGLAAGQTYTLKGVPRVGDPLIARWHPSKPESGDLVAITPTGTSISTTVGTQDIILVSGAKFSGRVTDPSNNGIPGVQVQIFPDSNPSAPIAQVVTDGTGNYTTQGVMEPDLSYKLGFLPTGTSYLGSFCKTPDPRVVVGNLCANSNNLSGAISITVKPEPAGVGEIIPANIVLQLGRRIAGRIQAREGATLLPNLGSAGKDVQVQITVFGGPSPTFDDLYQTFITSTAANIATLDYITAGLPDGNYKVRFAVQDSPNNTGFATVFYSSTICPNSLSSTASECLGASDKTDPTTTIVLNGSTVTPPNPPLGGGTAINKNITLQEGGQVTVILTFRDPVDNTIKSASNVAVEVIGDCRSTCTDPDVSKTRLGGPSFTDGTGTVTFRGLVFDPNGTGCPDPGCKKGNPISVRVSGNGFATAYITGTATPVVPTPQMDLDKWSYTINYGTIVTLTSQLNAGAELSGKIYDQNITSVAGAGVPAVDFGGTTVVIYDTSSTPKELYRFNSSNVARDNLVVFTQTIGGVTDWYYKLRLLTGRSYYVGFFPRNSALGVVPYQPIYYQNSSILATGGGLLTVSTPRAYNPATGNGGADAQFSLQGKIQVTVKDSNTGLAVQGATVDFYNTSGIKQPSTQTTPVNGIVTSTLLATGTGIDYRVSALVAGFPAFFYDGKGDLTTANRINIPAGTTVSIVITINTTLQSSASGIIKQQRVNQSPQAIAGATVSAVTGCGPGQSAIRFVTSSTDGSYDLGTFSGSNFLIKAVYRFIANVDTVVYYVQGNEFGTSDCIQATKLNAANPNTSITFDRRASLTGKVQLKNATNSLVGLPQNANVYLLDESGTITYATTTSDANNNGAYTILDQSPITYTVKFESIANTGTLYTPNPVFYNSLKADKSGVTDFAAATKLRLYPVTIAQITADDIFYTNPGPGGGCYILNATPVATTLSSIKIQFSSLCAGTGKLYAGLQPGVTSSSPISTTETDPGTINITADKTLTLNAASGITQADTNYYLRVCMVPPGGPAGEYCFPSELLVRTAAPGKNWYFGYGDTRSNANGSLVNAEFLHLFNYGSTTANVNLNYYVKGNNIPKTPVNSVTVPAGGRVDVEVSSATSPFGLNSLVAGGAEHATSIISDQPIMVERSIYNTTAGMSNGGTTSGGTINPGTASLNSDWLFPEASLDANIDTYYRLFNPATGSSPQNDVCISFSAYKTNGGGFAPTPDSKAIRLAPGQWAELNLRDLLSDPSINSPAEGAGVRFLTDDTCVGGMLGASPSPGGRFLAEQRILFTNKDVTDNYRKGETHLFGSLGASGQWYFLEGLSDKVYSRNYYVLNPNLNAVQVTLTIQLDNPPAGGNPVIQTYTVPGNGRAVIPVADLNAAKTGKTFGFSVQVNSSLPIAIQRSMKFIWRQQPVADGIFSQMGVTRFGSTWLFAAGSTASDIGNSKYNDMAINLYNPSGAVATLRITYYYKNSPSDATTQTQVFQDFALDKGTRTTIQPGAKTTIPGYPSLGAGKSMVAVKIESTNGQTIFAERVMFWSWSGTINGGNGVYGYNPPDQ